jgi:leucine-rich repeat protein SHOC2
MRPLDLSKGNHKTIPGNIPINFTWIILSNNEITEIPSYISELKNLERLSLSDNYINLVSPNFAKLNNLTWLDLTRNNLNSLPNLRFPKLVGLGLSENQFEEMPECVYNFIDLKNLDSSVIKLSFYHQKFKT